MARIFLFCIFSFSFSQAWAGFWLWESRESDPDLRVTVQGIAESYEGALEYAKTNDIWNDNMRLIAECPKDGWMAVVSVGFPKNHQRGQSLGGACEKSTKDAAIRSALASCKKRPSCAREISTLQYDVTVNWGRIEGGDLVDGETCTWDNIGNPNQKICFDTPTYPPDDEIGNYPRFDAASFIKKYSK